MRAQRVNVTYACLGDQREIFEYASLARQTNTVTSGPGEVSSPSRGVLYFIALWTLMCRAGMDMK